MDDTAVSEPTSWHRWFCSGIGAIAAAFSVGAAIESRAASDLVGGAGFLLLAVAWFRCPLDLNQSLVRQFRQALAGQEHAGMDRIATFSAGTGLAILIVSILLRWLA